MGNNVSNPPREFHQGIGPQTRRFGTVELTISYPKIVEGLTSTNFTEAGFDAVLAALQEFWPTHDVVLVTKNATNYCKRALFKNGCDSNTGSRNMKPEILFFSITITHQMMNQIQNVLHMSLDPEKLCSFRYCHKI